MVSTSAPPASGDVVTQLATHALTQAPGSYYATGRGTPYAITANNALYGAVVTGPHSLKPGDYVQNGNNIFVVGQKVVDNGYQGIYKLSDTRVDRSGKVVQSGSYVTPQTINAQGGVGNDYVSAENTGGPNPVSQTNVNSIYGNGGYAITQNGGAVPLAAVGQTPLPLVAPVAGTNAAVAAIVSPVTKDGVVVAPLRANVTTQSAALQPSLAREGTPVAPATRLVSTSPGNALGGAAGSVARVVSPTSGQLAGTTVIITEGSKAQGGVPVFEQLKTADLGGYRSPALVSVQKNSTGNASLPGTDTLLFGGPGSTAQFAPVNATAAGIAAAKAKTGNVQDVNGNIYKVNYTSQVTNDQRISSGANNVLASSVLPSVQVSSQTSEAKATSEIKDLFSLAEPFGIGVINKIPGVVGYAEGFLAGGVSAIKSVSGFALDFSSNTELIPGTFIGIPKGNTLGERYQSAANIAESPNLLPTTALIGGALVFEAAPTLAALGSASIGAYTFARSPSAYSAGEASAYALPLILPETNSQSLEVFEFRGLRREVTGEYLSSDTAVITGVSKGGRVETFAAGGTGEVQTTVLANKKVIPYTDASYAELRSVEPDYLVVKGNQRSMVATDKNGFGVVQDLDRSILVRNPYKQAGPLETNTVPNRPQAVVELPKYAFPLSDAPRYPLNRPSVEVVSQLAPVQKQVVGPDEYFMLVDQSAKKLSSVTGRVQEAARAGGKPTIPDVFFEKITSTLDPGEGLRVGADVFSEQGVDRLPAPRIKSETRVKDVETPIAQITKNGETGNFVARTVVEKIGFDFKNKQGVDDFVFSQEGTGTTVTAFSRPRDLPAKANSDSFGNVVSELSLKGKDVSKGVTDKSFLFVQREGKTSYFEVPNPSYKSASDTSAARAASRESIRQGALALDEQRSGMGQRTVLETVQETKQSAKARSGLDTIQLVEAGAGPVVLSVEVVPGTSRAGLGALSSLGLLNTARGGVRSGDLLTGDVAKTFGAQSVVGGRLVRSGNGVLSLVPHETPVANSSVNNLLRVPTARIVERPASTQFIPRDYSFSSLSDVSRSTRITPSILSNGFQSNTTTSLVPDTISANIVSNDLSSNSISTSTNVNVSTSTNTNLSRISSSRSLSSTVDFGIPEVPVPHTTKFSREEKKRKGLYNVLVRRHGVFGIVNSQSLGASDALELGKRVVENSAAASFRLEALPGADTNEVSSLVPRILGGGRFTTQKNHPDVYVQRNQFRISSPGELAQITIPGIQANKRKAKQGKGFFGGLGR